MLRTVRGATGTRPIWPENGVGHCNSYPRSRAIYAPAEIIPDTETPTEWSPYFIAVAQPYFAGWDELSQEGAGVMHVAQADLYDASPNPWPANGQFDHPNFFPGLLRLEPTTSAHRGFAQPTHPGPPMLFHAPPVFTAQTTPIPAVGV